MAENEKPEKKDPRFIERAKKKIKERNARYTSVEKESRLKRVDLRK
jgi:hypothetical protein